MNKIRKILLIIVCILVFIVFFYIDYSDLSWSKNRGNYIGIINGLLLIMLNVVAIRQEKAKRYQ